jgi:hypothetical protein
VLQLLDPHGAVELEDPVRTGVEVHAGLEEGAHGQLLPRVLDDKAAVDLGADDLGVVEGLADPDPWGDREEAAGRPRVRQAWRQVEPLPLGPDVPHEVDIRAVQLE